MALSLLLLPACSLAGWCGWAPGPQATERASVSSSGVQGDQNSIAAVLSADGRYVAFESRAANLVAGDTNGFSDVFVHDRLIRVTERVSVDSNGGQANYSCAQPAISADGRYVAFESAATNLVPGDGNGSVDVFLRDRWSGVTERVSVDSAGVQGNAASFEVSISADGRLVAFTSFANNLVPGDTNNAADVFWHDRGARTTARASADVRGLEGDWDSGAPSLSADGAFLAFHSFASNLVWGDGNNAVDVFVRDLQAGLIERVSVSAAGAEGDANSYVPSLSSGGRHVAYFSFADNLVPGDGNGFSDVFLHDRQTGATARVSVAAGGQQANGHSYEVALSADGRRLAFRSSASNLVTGDGNATDDVFLHDRQFGVTLRASVASSGAEGNGPCADPSISADGARAAFWSFAANLVPGDTNGSADAFVHERWPASSDAVLLDGPASHPAGAPLSLAWSNAPPGSSYLLAYSFQLGGTVAGGHAFDLGWPAVSIDTGRSSLTGGGAYTTPPVPPGAAGRTLYFELAARDWSGRLHDSNPLAITIL